MSDMNVKEAKKLWALIQSRWRELGDGERGEGSKKKIGYAMWLETDRKTPFDTWFKGIVNMAKSSNRHSRHHASKPINRRYEFLAQRFDTLPPDVLLSKMWNCSANGTISSIRARMKKRGFEFAELPDGQWRVTARPADQLLLPTQDQSAEHNTNALREDIARQNIRDMLDGKNDGRALDGKSMAQDVRDLGAAKERVKALLYIEGHVTGADLYALAADEIESLRAQVEDHIANALVRANQQAIMVEALKHIREMSLYHTDREIATKVLTDIGELQ